MAMLVAAMMPPIAYTEEMLMEMVMGRRKHRLVVMDLTIAVSQKQKRKTTTQRRIKWFKLKENDFQQEFKDRILRELSHDMEDVNTWWNKANSIILRAGKEILGESIGKVWENKDIWWFNEEVQEKLLNEENDRYLRGDGEPNDQEGAEITREEVNAALKKMKNGKAKGPDDILVEKGDIQSCENYRGIKLMSHTLKILERILASRLRQVVRIGRQQLGFMKGIGTVDGIFSLSQTMEKYQKQRVLHMVFVDLEKAYDRVPHQEVWRGFREREVQEKYVRMIQECYKDVTTRVRA
ncbi:uncharacterized protein LOC119585914 [Penaeus monodon]|uniref:uncharacterized protein LOC119585914 n=1 Tax=Penaeus monodon TaxID=6687 RepID=UPI0018A7CA27|nr:uncharacterized protein LOC119585914 [Penaeus monodon]